ncbi:hypothetical protein BW731_10685 [Vagococcus martis]|uniref:Cthe-2314-like HEPN domain-containing protein n=1 Tax=Vagococcus martis TaxID=1768210 RepID=A0A1V4DJI1_9ENTE|nr:hypothetical protein [Vagococcus martis]OPF88599.1 hypothetical protein BW731_10685 [Vagococcus martis]
MPDFKEKLSSVLYKDKEFKIKTSFREGFYNINHKELNDLIINLMDNNFKYLTDKKYILHWDGIVTYLQICSNAMMYFETFEIKQALLFNIFDVTDNKLETKIVNDFQIELNEKTLFNALKPDYFTYIVGAFTNLNVLHKYLIQFVKETKLNTYLTDEISFSTYKESIDKLKFIRNKVFIHPEGNNTLIDTYSEIDSIEDDFFNSEIEIKYIHKGEEYSENLIELFISTYYNLLSYFLNILILNNKNYYIDNTQ